jgi:hypothetical protein
MLTDTTRANARRGLRYGQHTGGPIASARACCLCNNHPEIDGQRTERA